jgi:hypothetical protein
MQAFTTGLLRTIRERMTSVLINDEEERIGLLSSASDSGYAGKFHKGLISTRHLQSALATLQANTS